MKELGEIIRIEHGAHKSFQDGNCAMELVAFMAGEKHSDHPECASPLIGDFVRSFNDRLGDEKRQRLAPYLIRIVGSRGTPEQEKERRRILYRWIYRNSIISLRMVGLDDAADKLEKRSVADAVAVAAVADAVADAVAVAAVADAFDVAVVADAVAAVDVADVADAVAAVADAVAAVAADAVAADAVAAVDVADAADAADAVAAVAVDVAYRIRNIPWRCLRVLAYRSITGKKTKTQAYDDAIAAMKPLSDLLENSGFELLDELIKVTETPETDKAIARLSERVEELRKLGVPV